jgi:hypothetical protein
MIAATIFRGKEHLLHRTFAIQDALLGMRGRRDLSRGRDRYREVPRSRSQFRNASFRDRRPRDTSQSHKRASRRPSPDEDDTPSRKRVKTSSNRADRGEPSREGLMPVMAASNGGLGTWEGESWNRVRSPPSPSNPKPKPVPGPMPETVPPGKSPSPNPEKI